MWVQYKTLSPKSAASPFDDITHRMTGYMKTLEVLHNLSCLQLNGQNDTKMLVSEGESSFRWYDL